MSSSESSKLASVLFYWNIRNSLESVTQFNLVIIGSDIMRITLICYVVVSHYQSFFFSIVKGFCCGYRHWGSIIREQRWCWFSWALVNHLYSVMTVCIIRETSHHHHHHAGPPPLSHRWRRSFYQTSKTGHGLWPQTLVQGFNSESFGLNHTAKVSSNIVWCWFNGCVVKKKSDISGV